MLPAKKIQQNIGEGTELVYQEIWQICFENNMTIMNPLKALAMLSDMLITWEHSVLPAALWEGVIIIPIFQVRKLRQTGYVVWVSLQLSLHLELNSWPQSLPSLLWMALRVLLASSFRFLRKGLLWGMRLRSLTWWSSGFPRVLEVPANQPRESLCGRWSGPFFRD